MNVELGIIISLVSVILTAIGFVIAQKRNSKDDGMSLRSIYGGDTQ